jgi:hypothetical protein
MSKSRVRRPNSAPPGRARRKKLTLRSGSEARTIVTRRSKLELITRPLQESENLAGQDRDVKPAASHRGAQRGQTPKSNKPLTPKRTNPKASDAVGTSQPEKYLKLEDAPLSDKSEILSKTSHCTTNAETEKTSSAGQSSNTGSRSNTHGKASMNARSLRGPQAAPSKHQLFKEAELRERTAVVDKYKATGDFSVIREFLAPFARGDKKRDLGPWKWDKEVERWFRRNNTTDTIIWAPTYESFM